MNGYFNNVHFAQFNVTVIEYLGKIRIQKNG